MNTAWIEFRRSVLAIAVLALVCCGLYPLLVTGLAQGFFPRQAGGSLVVDGHGRVRGSRWLGQAFSGPEYFHPRPSAAGSGYDAAGSGGSNLGPTSRKLRDLLATRLAAYRKENGLQDTDAIPADAVTASGSGLDPHISPANAQRQLARVAAARGLSEDKVRALLEACTEPRTLHLLGEPRVNVLLLNRALDEL